MLIDLLICNSLLCWQEPSFSCNTFTLSHFHDLFMLSLNHPHMHSLNFLVAHYIIGKLVGAIGDKKMNKIKTK